MRPLPLLAACALFSLACAAASPYAGAASIDVAAGWRDMLGGPPAEWSPGCR